MNVSRVWVVRLLALMLFVLFTYNCSQSDPEEIESGIIGLQEASRDDALNIVNWSVDGSVGNPKLSWVDWELKNDQDSTVWVGIAAIYTTIPTAAGVYYQDINNNNSIDVGDIFTVKAPEDGGYTLRWYIAEGYGEYWADY